MIKKNTVFILLFAVLLNSCDTAGQSKKRKLKISGTPLITQKLKIFGAKVKNLQMDTLAPPASHRRRRKQLFYKDKNHVYDKNMHVIDGVDPSSFKIISVNIFKDKDHVFHEKYPFNFIQNKEIDAKSFVYFGEKDGYEIMKDKNHVYLFYNEKFQVIKNADSKSFKKIYKNVYADVAHIYGYQGWAKATFKENATKKEFSEYDMEDMLAVEGGNLYAIDINPKKMRPLKYGVFTDENEVFSLKWSNVFENADPKTFKILNEAYATDKNHVYKYADILPEFDVKSFKVLSFTPWGTISIDKNGLYYDKIKIKDINVAKLKVLSNDYFKDDKNVYYKSFKIANADAKTFHLLKDENENPAIAVDANYVYWQMLVVEEVAPENIIQVLGKNEWLDNEHWNAIIAGETGGYELLQCKRIEADNLPAAAYYVLNGKVYYNEGGGYCEGKEIKNVDSKTFSVVNENYSKDKNYVYYEGKPMRSSDGTKLDPKTFDLFGINHGKDAKYYFRNGDVFGKNRSYRSKKIDFKTFTSIGYGWGFYKDKNHVYDDDLKILNEVDAKTVIPVEKY